MTLQEAWNLYESKKPQEFEGSPFIAYGDALRDLPQLTEVYSTILRYRDEITESEYSVIQALDLLWYAMSKDQQDSVS